MHALGVILRKHNQHTNKIALLDKNSGRVDLYINKNYGWSVGHIIEYTAKKIQENVIVVDDLKIHTIPLQLAQQDIFFLHHVLEVVYFFVPLGVPPCALYTILQALYQTGDACWYMKIQLQKIFLCKILLQVGVYDELPLQNKEILYSIINAPIDSIDANFLDLKQERSITQWISNCIMMHPALRLFKTRNFLTQNRIL